MLNILVFSLIVYSRGSQPGVRVPQGVRQKFQGVRRDILIPKNVYFEAKMSSKVIFIEQFLIKGVRKIYLTIFGGK